MSGAAALADNAALIRLAESVFALRDLAEKDPELEKRLCEFGDALTAVLCRPEINPVEPATGSACPAAQLQEAGHG